MVFTSLSFIILLLCLFFVYYVFSLKLPTMQWVVLLIFSLIFYTYSSPKYLIFLTVSIVVTWLTSLNIERKCALPLCIILNIGLLFFIKYAGVFSRITGHEIGKIIVPLGISFYTFQSIGYCIDVKRGLVEPEHIILKYALYVSFFPHISQGPIGRYEELMPQLMTPHRFDYDRFVRGLERILLGYFKKILIANNLARIVDEVYGHYDAFTGKTLIFATLMYAFQLYADFSGYMDIALGVGECLGIRLSENFNTPYFSKSISEYWRRWHITLGAWFKDYLYYPVLRSGLISKLGRKLRKSGHKKAAKNITTSIGLFITWLCIGMWHGSSLNFIAHGMFHAFFIILAVFMEDGYKKMKERLGVRENSGVYAAFQVIRTFTIVNIGYVFFRADSLRIALNIYKRMIMNFSDDGFIVFLHSYDRAFWLVTGFAMLVCIMIDCLDKKVKWIDALHKAPVWLRWGVVYLAGFVTLVYSFDQPVSAQAFLYFDF
ncbi:MAG: hypothetical protein K6E53_07555 [Lachnospiraceae bacterium]|nr:hypothetical protein [Lachnospiraceae bacterium]